MTSSVQNAIKVVVSGPRGEGFFDSVRRQGLGGCPPDATNETAASCFAVYAQDYLGIAPVAVYGTKADAVADLASIADGGWVEVEVDEDHSQLRTRYQKSSGALVYKLTLQTSSDSMTPVPRRAVRGMRYLPHLFDETLNSDDYNRHIWVPGNSTGWQRPDFYRYLAGLIRIYPAFSRLFPNNGYDDTLIGYEVLNATGLVRVTFEGDTAPDFLFVDNYTSLQPITGVDAGLIGSGKVTAIDTAVVSGETRGRVTIQMNGLNPWPSTAVNTYTAMTGFVQDYVINLGVNGGTLEAIEDAVLSILAAECHAGDAIGHRGDLINSVRTALEDLAGCISQLRGFRDAIYAVVPDGVDQFWSIENSLLIDPPDNSKIDPPEASAAYSAILRNAVIAAFVEDQMAVFDAQSTIYTKPGHELAASPLMNDELHPLNLGWRREAFGEFDWLFGLRAGDTTGLDIENPLLWSGAGNTELAGGTEFVRRARRLAQFSPFISETAHTLSPSAPWDYDPVAALDPDRYDTIGFGFCTLAGVAAGEGYMVINTPVPAGHDPARFRAGDIVYVQGWGTFKIPAGFSQAAYNNGGDIYSVQLSNLGDAVDTSVPVDVAPVVVVRQRSYHPDDIGYFLDPVTYPYRKRVTIPAAGDLGGGTGYIRIEYQDGSDSYPTPLSGSNGHLILEGVGEIDLSSMTAPAPVSNYFQTNLSITLPGHSAGDLSSLQGKTGWLFMEASADIRASIVRAEFGVTTPAVTFPASPVANANANTIWRFETGTYTPSLSALTTAPTGATFDSQAGAYTLINDRVFVDAMCRVTNVGSGGSGNVTLTLPFPVSGSNSVSANGGIFDLITYPSGVSQLAINPRSGTSYAYLNGSGSGISSAVVAWSNLTTNSRARSSFSYTTTH